MAELGLGVRLDTYRFADEQMHAAIAGLLGDEQLHARLTTSAADIQGRDGLTAAADVIEGAAA
jgi:UDP:flavonoid glycosyltransferase YjiC (YdhE family)